MKDFIDWARQQQPFGEFFNAYVKALKARTELTRHPQATDQEWESAIRNADRDLNQYAKEMRGRLSPMLVNFFMNVIREAANKELLFSVIPGGEEDEDLEKAKELTESGTESKS